MKKDKEITEVVFRNWKKEIIALFPYELYNNSKASVISYMHIGQHGEADYSYIIQNSKLATKKEYSELKKELEGQGYNLKVIKRINYDKYLKILRARCRTDFL